jgi:hypothetical protein
MYAELRVGNLKHSQSLAKEISPTGEGVNHIVKLNRHEARGNRQQSENNSFKTFKSFNRCALRLAARFKVQQFKSLTTGFRTKRGSNRSSDNRRVKIDREKIGWSESIAVGSLAFIDNVKSELGFRAAHRDVIDADGNDIAWSDRNDVKIRRQEVF